MSSSEVNLKNYRIPLNEIHDATENFSEKYQIGDGGFGTVYVGEFSERWGIHKVAIKRLNRDGHQGYDEFRKEVDMVSSFDHPNIIPIIGYCDEAGEMIILYEHAANGSLDHHLQDPAKRLWITWAKRLKICLGAARGLKHLHSDDRKVIHRDVKSANILLDANLEAKICDFGLSTFGPQNDQLEYSQQLSKATGTRFYIDPIYNERGRVSTKSDVYSFGVVLFEMSSGMMAHHYRRVANRKPQNLIDLVRSYYEDNRTEGGLDKLIDPLIKGRIDMNSFDTFNKIAYECINLKVKERPTVDSIIAKLEEAFNIQSPQVQNTISSFGEKLESYLIPLNEINRATENFSRVRCIGGGGFGFVYKGKLSKRWQNRIVAVKRLDPDSHQGDYEFRKEFEMISRFHHENIISFIGYCDENDEMILLYEYATNGSLEHHLQDPNKMSCITWTERLEICLGAARGLDYLHSGLGEHISVIHKDVKSANILLDGNWVAKISDFGSSNLASRNQSNQPNTQLYTKVAGTQFYLDPTYQENGILQKESDVYSFGIVLFEILSGMLAYYSRRNDDGREVFMMHLVGSCHTKDGFDKLTDPHIRDQIDSRSYDVFQEIAYECISSILMERPTMDKVIERIGEALDIQIEENVATLIECVKEDTGFSNGKPVAAFTIYKCLLCWKCLEAERTSVFDQLSFFIISAIEDGDNNDHMAYWLSNACNLLFLIYESFRRPPPRSWGYGRLKGSHSFAEAEDALEIEIVKQVKGKSPALLFKKRLIAYVEKMYGIICDNLKKELGSLLVSCIQSQATSEEVLISGPSFGKDSHFNHWQGIVDCLNTLLNTLKENFVPWKIVQKIFARIFSYFNVKIFNSLLLCRECSFKQGEYVKAGLAKLELWCSHATEEYAGAAWDELKHVRQAIRFLTLHQKDQLSYQEITNDLCPNLSIQQSHRLCTLYWDGNGNTPRVSQDVISIMRILMAEDSSGASSDSFLITEDSSSIPFSVDDLSTCLHVKDFTNVKPSIELRKYPAFKFLYN